MNKFQRDFLVTSETFFSFQSINKNKNKNNKSPICLFNKILKRIWKGKMLNFCFTHTFFLIIIFAL